MKTLKIAYYELKKLIRDKRWVLIFLIQPIVLIVLLGLSNYQEPKNIDLILFNRDKNIASYKIIENLMTKEELNVTQVETEQELLDKIEKNKARAGVILDVSKKESVQGKIIFIENVTAPDISGKAKIVSYESFEDEIREYTKTNVEAELNKEKDNKLEEVTINLEKDIEDFKTQLAKLNLPSIITSRINESLEEIEIDDENFKLQVANVPDIEVENTNNTTKDIKYFDFFASAVIVLLVVIVSLNTSSTALTQERIDGTLERFFVTPYKNSQLIIGKLLAYMFSSMALTLLTIFTLTSFFDVTVGPIWLVLLITFVTAITALSLGMFISAVTFTIAESILVSVLIFLSVLILTNFLFQPETKHWTMLLISKVIPFTYSINAMREVNLLNMGFYDIYKNFLIMLGFCAGFTIFSITLLRRKIN